MKSTKIQTTAATSFVVIATLVMTALLFCGNFCFVSVDAVSTTAGVASNTERYPRYTLRRRRRGTRGGSDKQQQHHSKKKTVGRIKKDANANGPPSSISAAVPPTSSTTTTRNWKSSRRLTGEGCSRGKDGGKDGSRGGKDDGKRSYPSRGSGKSGGNDGTRGTGGHGNGNNSNHGKSGKQGYGSGVDGGKARGKNRTGHGNRNRAGGNVGRREQQNRPRRRTVEFGTFACKRSRDYTCCREWDNPGDEPLCCITEDISNDRDDRAGAPSSDEKSDDMSDLPNLSKPVENNNKHQISQSNDP